MLNTALRLLTRLLDLIIGPHDTVDYRGGITSAHDTTRTGGRR